MQKLRFGILEGLLAISIFALMLQLMPSLQRWLIRAIDVRTWSLTTWFVVQGSILMILFCIRFWSDIVQSWGDHLARRANVAEKTKQRRQAQEAKERRVMIERIKDARNRRIY
jgi:hypothetical protein